MYIKYGFIHKPTVTRAYTYICIFVSQLVNTAHLELVSDLHVSTDTFIASLRCFIAHHGKQSLIWNDYGSNLLA